jgi:hypothetical protein
VDCRLAPWGIWEPCDKSCGKGEQQRSRIILEEPNETGEACDDRTERQDCNDHKCPIDCVMETQDWGGWEGCTATCGHGTNTRRKTVTTWPDHGGVGCGQHTQTVPCNTFECPIDCEMADWVAWGACTHTCITKSETDNASNKRTRTRGVKITPNYGGKACPTKRQDEEDCNPTVHCPVDCKIEDTWQPWSTCSKSCGVGNQTRIKDVLVPKEHAGADCGKTSDTRDCNIFDCAVDCVAEWGQWTPCSRSCGEGIQTNTRITTTHPNKYGRPCPTDVSKQQICNKHQCPVDCVQSKWTGWSTCDQLCNGGKQWRTRETSVEMRFGGKACTPESQTLDCNTHNCPIDATYSQWTGWGDCSATCDTGTMDRYRSEVSPALHDGIDGLPIHQSMNCQQAPCGLNCVHQDWSSWGSCSKTCGGGGVSKRHRLPSKDQDMRHRMRCQTLTESQPCGGGNCPVDCKLSLWSGFTACTADCNGGLKSRSRSVIEQPLHEGRACGSLVHRWPCNAHGCDVDCKMSNWTDLNDGACSATCGAGARYQMRSIERVAEYGGKRCGSTNKAIPCKVKDCDEDCELKGFGPYSYCDKSCGGGKQFRAKHVVRQPVAGGAACPAKSDLLAWREERDCNLHSCPVARIEDHFEMLDTCNKTVCKFHTTHAGVTTNRTSVKVLHHHTERYGSKHVCRALPIPSSSEKNCVCKCYMPGETTIAALVAKAQKLAAALSNS